ncbi:unnamed protein product, partial [marine sediment metagenome]
MIKDRLKIFRENVFKKNKDIEGFLVFNYKNLTYLSDFDGEGLALITKGDNFLITDSRYTEQAQKESPDFKIITEKLKQKNSRIEALNKIIKKKKLKKITFESS